MLCFFAALACNSSDSDAPENNRVESGDDTATGPDTDADVDGDGYAARVDCDDNDADVHPDATETCGNGRDDNCNGTADGCDWSGANELEGTELTAHESLELGTALSVCDANGDGINDVVVSAPGNAYVTGGVYVFHGPIDEDRDASDADYTLFGAGPSLYTGATVDCRGDIDGDGLPDIIVGEPSVPDDLGAMYVASGLGTGSVSLWEDASREFLGSYDDANLGWQLVAIDVGGDATDELAVSVGPWNWGSVTNHGAVYVFEGGGPGVRGTEQAAAYIYGDAQNRVDTIVGNAGDLDGDGLEELVVGSNEGDSQALLVFWAPLSGAIPNSDADVQIVGGPIRSVSFGGIGHADFDHDGHDDLFFGNSSQDNSVGEVFAFLDPPDDITSTASANLHVRGSETQYGAGSDVTSPGDVDGDGRADLLIGAAGSATVFLFYGGDPGAYDLANDSQASWQDSYGSSRAGATVAAADVTGDGVVEFLIAAPDDGDGANGIVTILPSFHL